MNSLERLIGVLDLFGEAPGVFTAEQLHERLGYTRSTLYRYLKLLTDSGFITSFHGSGFTLGPRIIELSALIMKRDPLILAARPLMMTLSRQNRATVLLCRRFRDRVLCVHQESPADSQSCAYVVGMPQSLTRGAASRIILAHLPSPQVRKLFDAEPRQFSDVGIGHDLTTVRRRLRRIREQGFEMSTGEVQQGVTAIAAPIVDAGANIVGSLCVSIPQIHFQEGRLLQITEHVVGSAEAISHTISGDAFMVKAG